MRRWIFSIVALVGLMGCEKPILPDGESSGTAAGAVTLEFTTTNTDYTTRAASGIAAHASKLNVQLFDEDGQKVFSTVRTQTKDDDGFGTMEVELADGVYTVVAVAHSSARSATIKSPEVVQFTAQDGEKLTDTIQQ